jgi:mRNA-degrading endonuclease RelE of RelBE toxin-antitoxin system
MKAYAVELTGDDRCRLRVGNYCVLFKILNDRLVA